jgi:hypothetical protein
MSVLQGLEPLETAGQAEANASGARAVFTAENHENTKGREHESEGGASGGPSVAFPPGGAETNASA